jgi:Fe-S-cluster containining protein
MTGIPFRLKEKCNQLSAIYAEFDEETKGFRESAVCRPGCTFCCRGPGPIDTTTLEGLVILDQMRKFPKSGRKRIEKAVDKDRRLRENHSYDGYGPCPFLQKNQRCRIYHQRPFACRRLYSLKVCSDEQAPLLHRRVMEIAESTRSRLQRLDDTGYTGHLSFILFMLNNDTFLETYLSGDFAPEQVVNYGKSHGIVINRRVA